MNKTLAIELEDLKNLIIEKLNEEEIGLWHGSSIADAGWNRALDRVREIVRFEV